MAYRIRKKLTGYGIIRIEITGYRTGIMGIQTTRINGVEEAGEEKMSEIRVVSSEIALIPHA